MFIFYQWCDWTSLAFGPITTETSRSPNIIFKIKTLLICRDSDNPRVIQVENKNCFCTLAKSCLHFMQTCNLFTAKHLLTNTNICLSKICLHVRIGLTDFFICFLVFYNKKIFKKWSQLEISKRLDLSENPSKATDISNALRSKRFLSPRFPLQICLPSKQIEHWRWKSEKVSFSSWKKKFFSLMIIMIIF